MITQIRGKLIEVHPSHAVVDCNGVGYHLNISLNTYSKVQKEENVLFFTHHLLRDDAQILYGFADKEERLIFEKLISVNGVGPASGLMIISTLSPAEIYHAIANEDAKTLQTVKGIGMKTAQRIIIDLKDKLSKLSDLEFNATSSENKIKFEALSALEILGISKKQSEKVIQKLIVDNPQITLETLIKETLKKL